MGQIYFYVDYLTYLLKDFCKNKDLIHGNSNVLSCFLFRTHM